MFATLYLFPIPESNVTFIVLVLFHKRMERELCTNEEGVVEISRMKAATLLYEERNFPEGYIVLIKLFIIIMKLMRT